ncbi:MAG TPA: oxygen-independent coproporphyrinogen III oxidase [Blastocatellia bacterium]|nr:oxygen-independent coproporphyrinogen III oxidase [Blastocatellia bacterium]HAF24402.1 oxygen-independent coproporphyrinogen III oxidase [Blastocatellia bacterium]HCX28864.1 oxygen-independent coproporphyrinogen III oxidase [Blastocatellia bacterium]
MIATTAGLLRKYDVPGPRYTSYPTILYWDTETTLARWLDSTARSLSLAELDGTGAAIYVHIPFCRSLCTYCGCNSRITCSTSVGKAYVRSVLKEWELYRRQLGRSAPIPLSELHLGGGTPTFLSADELDELISGILKHVKQTPDAEFSIESDPRVTRPDHLAVLRQLGFRRLSLGIQDFDPRVQEAVNRIQSEQQVRLVTEHARALGFNSINYDLIYGLPFQNLNSVERTVEATIRLQPERIAFYAYAHVPWVKPGQRHFTEDDLPSGEEKRNLYEFGRTMLEQAGYIEIGMDHLALKTDSLWKAAFAGTLHRNFMGYTSRFVSPLIGLGVSSISDSWDVFVQNEKQLETYEARVAQGEIPIFRGHELSEEDKILRRHILNLMTRFETCWDSPELYVPYLDSVAKKLEEPRRDGLVRLSANGCEVTNNGKAFLRNICMAFDARLARQAPTTQLFSRTI